MATSDVVCCGSITSVCSGLSVTESGHEIVETVGRLAICHDRALATVLESVRRIGTVRLVDLGLRQGARIALKDVGAAHECGRPTGAALRGGSRGHSCNSSGQGVCATGFVGIVTATTAAVVGLARANEGTELPVVGLLGLVDIIGLAEMLLLPSYHDGRGNEEQGDDFRHGRAHHRCVVRRAECGGESFVCCLLSIDFLSFLCCLACSSHFFSSCLSLLLCDC